MKVYVVKERTLCECSTQCFCAGYEINSIWTYKKLAENRKKDLFKAYIDEYTIEK